MVDGNESLLAHGFEEIDVAENIVLAHNHAIALAFGEERHGVEAEVRSENAIRRDRCAASLGMAQNCRARFDAGQFLNALGNDIANAIRERLALV